MKSRRWRVRPSLCGGPGDLPGSTTLNSEFTAIKDKMVNHDIEQFITMGIYSEHI